MRQAPRSRSRFSETRLSTLVVADTDGTLSTSTVGPVTTNLGSGVAVFASSGDNPETENSLGENIEDSVDDDLGANLNLPSGTSSTPDNNVDDPKDQRSDRDRAKESGNFGTASSRGSSAVDSDVPNGKDKADDADSIPSPLLSSVGMSDSRESTSEDKDDIGDDGHDGVTTINTSQQAKLNNQNGCRESPINVACPEDLATDIVVGVGDVLVVVSYAGAVEVRGLTGSHGEVGQG